LCPFIFLPNIVQFLVIIVLLFVYMMYTYTYANTVFTPMPNLQLLLKLESYKKFGKIYGFIVENEIELHLNIFS
jgi:hypothetical protein